MHATSLRYVQALGTTPNLSTLVKVLVRPDLPVKDAHFEVIKRFFLWDVAKCAWTPSACLWALTLSFPLGVVDEVDDRLVAAASMLHVWTLLSVLQLSSVRGGASALMVMWHEEGRAPLRGPCPSLSWESRTAAHRNRWPTGT